MRYATEKEMYPAVCRWLEGFLRQRHPRSKVIVKDASRQPVYRVLRKLQLPGLPSDWGSWDIRADVLGIVSGKASTRLAIVECKNTEITLSHLSQLLGYCRVAQPEYAFILSPSGASDMLKRLLQTYGRKDVLEYQHKEGKVARSLVIARWDPVAKNLDYGSLIMGDDHVGRI
jgi:hypothetical protein